MDETKQQVSEALLRKAAGGDSAAADRLLVLHKNRLRAMIALRLDQRLSARVDPSDVVQETLAEAHVKLPEYLRTQSVPFYPWLRRLAWERVVRLHRQHLIAEARTVTREENFEVVLPDQSALQLAYQFVANGSTPSEHVIQAELKGRVRTALGRLDARDREVLILRYLEHLSIEETAATLELSTGAVKSRQRRALERFSQLVQQSDEDGFHE
ncbi:sigma-70 family RNA polymerase sigma factor [Pirellulales bacterium]|nr:sigma-70 family RNA polymerase sigma factor [Pirellulales bacterium]